MARQAFSAATPKGEPSSTMLTLTLNLTRRSSEGLFDGHAKPTNSDGCVAEKRRASFGWGSGVVSMDGGHETRHARVVAC